MGNSKNVILKNIVKDFIGNDGNLFTAVNNVNVEIKAEEFVTLLGPSGCGKTTILRMIAGFEMPNEGEVFIGGEDVSKLTPDKRDTAMVFQSYALFPHLNIYDNIAYGLKLKKISKKEINEKVKRIIELVGLSGLEKRAPNQLSGGQQQRVALARSLVMEPSVLLFDEPLSNLDAKLRVYMRGEIRKIQKEFGITSIYVTHDQAEAMSMSDRVIIMNKGVVEQVGTPQEIYKNPATRFVADFIGEANVFEAKVKDIAQDYVEIEFLKKLFKVKTKVRFKIGDKANLVIRPEAIKLKEEGDIKVEIKSSVFMGAYQDYVLEAEGVEIKMIDYDPSHKKVFYRYEYAYLEISEEAIHLIN